jgi:hypothetical protein
MAVARKRSSWWSTFFGVRQEPRPLAADLLRGCYIREKQQAMRYREHAQRMRYAQFREALIRMAQVQDDNATALAQKIEALGEALPDVPPVDVANKRNSWYYLSSDLEEEQRTAGELSGDLVAISAEFPEVAELLRRIENDGRKHRAELRDMLARSDPQAAAP